MTRENFRDMYGRRTTTTTTTGGDPYISRKSSEARLIKDIGNLNFDVKISED